MNKFGKFIVLFFIATLLCSCAPTGEQIIQQLRDKNSAESLELAQFTTYYYLHPQNEQLIPSLQKTLKFGIHGFGAKILVHFYAAAINNSNNKDQLLQKLNLLKQQYSKEQQQTIEDIIDQTTNFHSPLPSSSDNFDFLWTEFFATGNELPVKEIASYLKMNTYKRKIEVIQLAAAEWSLAANANQHKRVYAILKRLYISSQGIMKKRLKRILDDPSSIAVRFSAWGELRNVKDFNTFKNIVW